MRWMFAVAASALLLVLAGTIGCNTGAEPVDTAPAESRAEPAVVEEPGGATTEEYEIRGTVTAIDREDVSVTLDHEEIAGLMKAMTMKFQVADPQILEGIEEGDEVQGQLVERDGQYVITDVRERTE